jgi:hypothetical protein
MLGLGSAEVTHVLRVPLIVLGLAILLIVVANRLARRAGGWYFVRRRVRREVRLTAAAFAAPVRNWFQYRRRLRLLSRLLADPAVWQAGERAVRSVDAVTPEGCRPYATVVGDDLVGVFVGGLAVTEPPDPWISDDTEPGLWWSVRETWNDQPGPDPSARSVLLTALGVDGARAVFLDLADGPPVTALYGDERAAHALLQAMAAQLDQRLPPGAVTVAQGVHPRHAGPPMARALREAADWCADHGAPAVAVCADPLPEPIGPDGPFVLVQGRAHGRARLLTVSRNGVVVHGTPLRPDATALPRAVARAIGSLPPHRPPSARTAQPARTAPLDTPVLGRSASPGAASPSTAPATAATAGEPTTAPGVDLPPVRSASVPVPAAEPAAARTGDQAGRQSPTGVSASADAPGSAPPDPRSAPGEGG